MPAWRELVSRTLEPHFRAARPLLEALAEDKRALEAWPHEERAQLGLFSPRRQALVFEATYAAVVEPRLRALDLL